jgi:DNA polymerase bacteriophage-type
MLERTNREISNSTAPGYDGAQHVLHRDYETRGVLALNKVGAHRYAADSRTSVVCCAYVADSGPVKLWIPGDAIPSEFIEAANNPNWIVVAHNAAFEMAIEQHILGPRFGWPAIPLERQRCTMAAALAGGLPARLSAVADALELANRKDAAGERLMHQTSKPRRPRQGEDPANVYWFEDPDRVNRVYGYCRQDVEVETELRRTGRHCHREHAAAERAA